MIYIVDYSKNDTILKKEVLIEGSGNVTECEDILDHFVYKTPDPSRCWPKPCAIGTVYQPTISTDMEFYALSGFVYGVQALHVADDEDMYSPDMLREAALAYCVMVRKLAR